MLGVVVVKGSGGEMGLLLFRRRTTVDNGFGFRRRWSLPLSFSPLSLLSLSNPKTSFPLSQEEREQIKRRHPRHFYTPTRRRCTFRPLSCSPLKNSKTHFSRVLHTAHTEEGIIM